MRTLEVDCRGRDAAVEIVGSGRDIVFVGTAAPMTLTRPAANSLASLGYRVTNFDYGLGHPSPEPRTALDQVPDVVAVMDAADVPSAVVIGVSRGAMTAYDLAGEDFDRVAALVLVMPVAGFADTLQIVSQTPAAQPSDGPDTLIRQLADQVFSARFLEERLDDAIELLSAAPGAVDRVERSDETPFPEGLVVGCPILIIEGDADLVVTPEHPARYRAQHPEAEHRVVADGSHGWIMEEPAAFASMVDDFVRLQDLSGAGPGPVYRREEPGVAPEPGET